MTTLRLPSNARTPIVFLCILLGFVMLASGQNAPSTGAKNTEHTTQLSPDVATQASQRGAQALAVRDYEMAFAEYRTAVDAVADDLESEALRKTTLAGFTKAAMGLAEQRIAEGRWQDAKNTVESLLRSNPNCKPAKDLLEHLEDPNYFNKTVTPDFVYQVETVKSLLLKGRGLLDSGRYDEAQATYDSILQIDRYNIAAWQGIEEVNKAKRRVADVARKATAPLLPDGNHKPGLWLLIATFVVVALAGLALIARCRCKTGSPLAAGESPTRGSALLPWCWLILAVVTLAFFTAYSRYEFMPVSSDGDRWVLKIDRWTGVLDKLAY